MLDWIYWIKLCYSHPIHEPTIINGLPETRVQAIARLENAMRLITFLIYVVDDRKVIYLTPNAPSLTVPNQHLGIAIKPPTQVLSPELSPEAFRANRVISEGQSARQKQQTI